MDITGEIINFAARCDTATLPAIPQEDAYNQVNYAIEELSYGRNLPADSLHLAIMYGVVSQAEVDSISTLDDTAASDFLIMKRDEYWQLVIPTAVLNWAYEGGSMLQNFEVYRSMDGSAFVKYDTPLPTETAVQTYEDSNVSYDHFYIYQIRAAHVAGQYSEKSEALIVKPKIK